MDFKAFYHQPESFSDADLKILRNKIFWQSYSPYLSGFGMLGLAWVVERAIWKKHAARPIVLAPAFILGLYVGMQPAAQIHNKGLSQYSADAQEVMDHDILRAHEKRQL